VIWWAGEAQGIIGFAMALAFRKPGNYRGTVIEIDGFWFSTSDTRYNKSSNPLYCRAVVQQWLSTSKSVLLCSI
jgi:hypothetical protein